VITIKEHISEIEVRELLSIDGVVYKPKDIITIEEPEIHIRVI